MRLPVRGPRRCRCWRQFCRRVAVIVVESAMSTDEAVKGTVELTASTFVIQGGEVRKKIPHLLEFKQPVYVLVQEHEVYADL